ncbi:Zinc knuckle [Popillia japonica]|uniref:Zinc knuckle n=1 Tax=Popillia japonica TaxID=7064 RepID=A0AAW1L7A4_POPJA
MLKYNGLAELIRRNEGEVDFLIQTARTKTRILIQTARTKTRISEQEETTSAVYLVPMKIDKSGVNDKRAGRNHECRLPGPNENRQVRSKRHGRGVQSNRRSYKEFKRAPHGNDQHGNRRWFKSGVINVGSTPRKRSTWKVNIKAKIMLQEIKSEPQTRKKEKAETVVTIKAGGKSYVDVVKKLKDEVDIGKIGVKIGKIRKTGNEDLMLVVEGGDPSKRNDYAIYNGMASTLEKEIKNKIENIRVVTRAKEMTTLYIMGMDPTSNEEEVKQAIARETNLRETEIQVKAIRKGRYEEQTAIVELPRGKATALIQQRKMRIGWVECGVKERIYLTRCFKCLEYGHKTRDCTAKVDRSDECYKCGSKGHRSKECKNEETAPQRIRRQHTRTRKNASEEERQNVLENHKKCKKNLRKLIRDSKTRKNASEEERQNVLENHKKCKKNLRKLIRDSKQRHWKELCKSLNNDVWGDGFKIAEMHSRGSRLHYKGTGRGRDLFPYPTRETCEYRKCIAEAPAFTTKELEEVLSNMKPGKAPGLDAIPLEAIKEATLSNMKPGQWQDEDVRTSPIYRLQGDKQMEAMDVEDIQRTKRKRLRELDQVVGNLENRWEKFLEAETCVETGTNAMKQNAGTQRSSKPIEIQATLSTIGTQTDWEDAELQRAKKDTAVREGIKRAMLEPKSFQNLTSIIDMPWPSDIFTHTQVLEMAPTSFRAEGDFAIHEFTLHVLDIDAALTKEEVETTIKDSVGNRDAHTIRVKSMRPSRDGNQIATVHASRTAGNALVQKGRIKIGWVGCERLHK